jgi:hypothetical protein
MAAIGKWILMKRQRGGVLRIKKIIVSNAQKLIGA